MLYLYSPAYSSFILSILEMLLKAEYWTVDPYMRVHCIDNMKIGEQFEGAQVARYIYFRTTKSLNIFFIILIGWFTYNFKYHLEFLRVDVPNFRKAAK